ncbi:MAG: tetratricopeptide repeat protein [Fidelibacterota bacterium]
MNRLRILFVHLIAASILATMTPVPLSPADLDSSTGQSKKRQTRKKPKTQGKSVSKKPSSKKKGSRKKRKASRPRKQSPTKGKKRLSRKKKRRPSSKKASARKKPSRQRAKRAPAGRRAEAKPRTISPKPKSIYEVSDNIYQMTHELDAMVRQMRKAQTALRPVERQGAPETVVDRIERAERKLSEQPDNRYAQRELGLKYERRGMFAKAKDIYLRMIASDPTNPDYHYFLGSLYSRMGQPRKAKFSYEEALEIDPNHAATINELSHYSDRSQGGEMASELMEKAASKEPEGQARRLKDVRENLRSGSYEKAITLSQEGRNLYPDNPVFPYLAGQAYEALGDLEEAKKSYKLSMTMDRSDPSAGKTLGDLYFNQGNYLYAAITYESALDRSPRDVDLRFRQGLGYFKAFEWGKAASAWEDLLRYAPNHPEVRQLLPQVYYILSLEYKRNGFTDLSRRAFSNALSVNPRTGDWLKGALKTSGGYYREHGLNREALGAYQDAIDLDPTDAEDYNGLGITYWYMDEKEMAVAAWEKSISLKPEDNSARGWLLLANRKSGS